MRGVDRGSVVVGGDGVLNDGVAAFGDVGSSATSGGGGGVLANSVATAGWVALESGGSGDWTETPSIENDSTGDALEGNVSEGGVSDRTEYAGGGVWGLSKMDFGMGSVLGVSKIDFGIGNGSGTAFLLSILPSLSPSRTPSCNTPGGFSCGSTVTGLSTGASSFASTSLFVV